jgi:rhamnulokinase
MTNCKNYLAADLGAGSGRVILGQLQDNKLTLKEIHRFNNETVTIDNHYYWNILQLFTDIKRGIELALKEGVKISSISVDAWGVDFALLGSDGQLLSNPHTYRDPRTNQMQEKMNSLINEREAYQRTGIQSMFFNTTLQLLGMHNKNDPTLELADSLLFIPDLLNYFLCGEKVSELSIASTSQFLNSENSQWDENLIDRLNIKKTLFQKIVPTGSIIGKIKPEITNDLKCNTFSVIASAGHDTQAAIASVPASGYDHIYLSSGTWSIIGVECDEAQTGELSQKLGFSNEKGVAGKTNLLKNIMGMWLIQECKRIWDRDSENNDYETLIELAANAPALKSILNLDDECFIAPIDMPQTIVDFCKKTQQNVPDNKGTIIRCIIDSLALKYRQSAEQLAQITGQTFNNLHIVGGGIQNQLLCQLSSDAIGCTVIAGPIEATAAGNILIQAIAMGDIESLNQGREIIRSSFSVKTYQPMGQLNWDEAYQKMIGLSEKT